MSLRYWAAAPDIFKTLNSFYRNRKSLPGQKTMVSVQNFNIEHRYKLRHALTGVLLVSFE